MSNIVPTEKWRGPAEQYKLHAADFVNCCSSVLAERRNRNE